MKRIIYTSIKSENMTEAMIYELLEKSKENNDRFGITGMLVYDGVYFLQCIEGERGAVDQLMINLLRDERHRDFIKLGEELTKNRLFPEWNMGFSNDKITIAGVFESICGTDFLDPDDLSYEDAKAVLERLSFIVKNQDQNHPFFQKSF
jgi:hypothetical protein